MLLLPFRCLWQPPSFHRAPRRDHFQCPLRWVWSPIEDTPMDVSWALSSLSKVMNVNLVQFLLLAVPQGTLSLSPPGMSVSVPRGVFMKAGTVSSCRQCTALVTAGLSLT